MYYDCVHTKHCVSVYPTNFAIASEAACSAFSRHCRNHCCWCHLCGYARGFFSGHSPISLFFYINLIITAEEEKHQIRFSLRESANIWQMEQWQWTCEGVRGEQNNIGSKSNLQLRTIKLLESSHSIVMPERAMTTMRWCGSVGGIGIGGGETTSKRKFCTEIIFSANFYCSSIDVSVYELYSEKSFVWPFAVCWTWFWTHSHTHNDNHFPLIYSV